MAALVARRGRYTDRDHRRRNRAAKSQGWRCVYCGVRMSKRSDDVKEPYFGTWEHVTPRSRGGKKGGNRVVACRACNRLRGNTILPLFLAEHPIIGLYSLCGHPWVEEQIREGYMPKVDRYHTLTVA